MTITKARRAAIVDLGSNSVRMVVFEGEARNPIVVFNEKAVVRLGKGLQETGGLNPEGIRYAKTVLARFYTIARGMEANPFEVLATAAVRDAKNGPEFIASIKKRMPGVNMRILSGEEEASYSAAGLMCGIPDAQGIVADIGGGSLELVHLHDRQHQESCTLKLGVIRLSERSKGSLSKAKAIAVDDLKAVDWVKKGRGKPLYLVGGAFRALAKIHMASCGYPLKIVHLYSVSLPEMRPVLSWILSSSKKVLEDAAIVPRRRVEDTPYAAAVLRALLHQIKPSKIIFSEDGLREGWYMQSLPPFVQQQDPWLEAAFDLCQRFGRSQGLPRRLAGWTAPVFPKEKKRYAYLREVACWISDIGANDHPEYRAVQSYERIMRMPGSAFDHASRAFLALALAVRYEADETEAFLQSAYRILSEHDRTQAIRLGYTLRLAYLICGGVETLLDGTRLALQKKNMQLIISGNERYVALSREAARCFMQLTQAFTLKGEIVAVDSSTKKPLAPKKLLKGA